MGKCLDKKVVQTRQWIDPSITPSIPTLDYELTFPRTVYSAITREMDDQSTTLEDELLMIADNINKKQPLIPAGNYGKLMTFGRSDGEILPTEIIQSIANEPSERSSTKVVSEKAAGILLDQIASTGNIQKHITDTIIHITEEERAKWNSTPSSDDFNHHIDDTNIHVTKEDHDKINNSVLTETFHEHSNDMNNPHNVTAAQVGTYYRKEIDDMFQSIRQSFFKQRNIQWTDTGTTPKEGDASLVDYQEANWNPDWVISYNNDLEDLPADDSKVYFALRPTTDYSIYESNDCDIYIKRPVDSEWIKIGVGKMEVGDMVLSYTDANMYSWFAGRFVTMFGGSGGGSSYSVWKPITTIIDGNVTLNWVRASFEEPTQPDVVISGPKGEPGKDGKDGEPGYGVPAGGNAGYVLAKRSNTDYDTEWIPGGGSADTVHWDNIIDVPTIYNSLGNDPRGIIAQSTLTEEFNKINTAIGLIEDVPGEVIKIMNLLDDHVNDFNNPHKITTQSIGAVDKLSFLEHVNNTNNPNPHNVTTELIGAVQKTVFDAFQLSTGESITNINDVIAGINKELNDGHMVSNVYWDENTWSLNFVFRSETDPELKVPIPISDIFSAMYYDESDHSFVIPLPDGTSHRISVESLITEYQGTTTDTINIEVNGDKISAVVRQGSINSDTIASDVHLPGYPTAATAQVDDKSTTVATTEFVKNVIIDSLDSDSDGRALSARMGKKLATEKASMDWVEEQIKSIPSFNVINSLNSTSTEYALSANMGYALNLTKAPKVHTDATGATYGKATADLFGHSRAANIMPAMNGEAYIGDDDGFYARQGHVHPTDTTRAPLTFGPNDILTNGKATTPAVDSNDRSIATTEWIVNRFNMVTLDDIPSIVAQAYDEA